MMLTEQYDGNMFCHLWKMLSILKIGTKKFWIDALGRSADKPKMEYCEDHNGTIHYIRGLPGHTHGVATNPNLFPLKQIPLG